MEVLPSFNQQLFNIQQKLKAPKDKKNNFGKYNYRNAETILEHVKPLLMDENATLTFNEELVNLGIEDRYQEVEKKDYKHVKVHGLALKVTAYFKSKDGEEMATSFAGIDVLKKGMDFAQCYGSSSSYAKKYAMCSLFAIDDSELDPDAKEPQSEQQTKGQGNPEQNKLKREFLNKYNEKKHGTYNVEYNANSYQFAQVRKSLNTAPDDLIQAMLQLIEVGE